MVYLNNFIKRYTSPLYAIIVAEIIGVIFVIVGIFPPEAALFLTGVFIFFVLFAPLKQAVLFAVFSIPLYIALPISESFDMMASWRIIVAILFLRALMKGGWGIVFWRIWRLFWHGLRLHYLYPIGSRSKTAGTSEPLAGGARMSQEIIPRTPLLRLGILVGLFFAIGALSLFVAQEPIFGIKKLIYFANIFALFFVIRTVVRSKDDFLGLLKYTFAGSLVALIVGYAQFLTVLFIPLYVFWQWWAHSVIPIFYGEALGNLLSYSNTWFSYYKDAEATLRMFSFFPDSHSFALFTVFSLPVALTFFVLKKYSKLVRILFGVTAILILLSIILSGTRGLWVGAVPVFLILVVAYSFFTPSHRLVIKITIASFIIFALLFPISSQILKFSQMRQGGKVSQTSFERISSSLSTQEHSNKGRIQIWESTFTSIVKYPFLGVGIGNYPLVLGENISATKEGASAHSLYLDTIAEMGIFAGIILLLIFLEILWRALTVFSKTKDVVLQLFAGFFAVYFIWVVVYSAVDVVLFNDKVLLLFTVLVALLYAGFNKHRHLQRGG